ncbi:MAG: bifunctional metallophosphatase/5'-nucleotidase [Polyangiaceae bacterium]|nr:bifunctional metallophosphatase/5'-nucleotidase [Polyangiaceae bacterium]
MRTTIACALTIPILAACRPQETTATPTDAPTTTSAAPSAAPVVKDRTISIVGTNDLHGRVAALPLLGGYLDNLRRARERDGGGVVLVDGGDMFQGTLESNLLEGRPVRDAYAALGYAAATVGNHEFDYGPLGAEATPKRPGDDPRGALKALAKDSPFPFLMANVRDRATGARAEYPNMPGSTIVTVDGIRIGLVGVTTEDTLRTTISSNVKDLEMAPVAETIRTEAAALRKAGARAVIVLAHAGGKCQDFTNDISKDRCELGAEIFDVANALPPGTVDAIVAGHTHAGVAHTVHDIPIIEAYSYGRAFGRIDFTFRGDPPAIVAHHIHAPRELCPGVDKPDFSKCSPGEYEGAPVERSKKVEAAIAGGVEAARERRASKLGPVLAAPIPRSYLAESALGNLFADLTLRGTAGADIAMANGGGLREDLPAGELTYGALFESFPFDNRVATAKVKVADFKRLVASHLKQAGNGVLSFAGVRIHARCKDKKLDVQLERTTKGKPFRDDDTIVIAASDFMMLGGDTFWGDLTPPEFNVLDDLLRDVFERELKKEKTLRAEDLFDPKKRRLDLEKSRPIKCD